MTPTVHSSVHILTDRPAVETGNETYPSVVISERSGEVIDYATLTVSVTGDMHDRLAFAADLRRAAAFVEAWERPVTEPSEPNDEHPSWCGLDDGHIGLCRQIDDLAYEGGAA